MSSGIRTRVCSTPFSSPLESADLRSLQNSETNNENFLPNGFATISVSVKPFLNIRNRGDSFCATCVCKLCFILSCQSFSKRSASPSGCTNRVLFSKLFKQGGISIFWEGMRLVRESLKNPLKRVDTSLDIPTITRPLDHKEIERKRSLTCRES